MPHRSDKLGRAEFHLLWLAQRGADDHGWAPVSNVVWPHLASVPADLLEREWPEGAEKGGCQLTPAGAAVLKYGSSRQ